MKTFVCKLLSVVLLTSCSFSETPHTESGVSQNISELTLRSSTGAQELDAQVSIHSGALIEDTTKKDIEGITHDNFKPLLVNLERFGKENVRLFDCKQYFFLPDSEKRPQYQIDIQNEYIQKCEDLKK